MTMASVVRASKYRHVFGTAYKREECFENLRVSISAWDTNYVAANPKYLSVNWNAGGGGAFCVVPHAEAGKLRGDFPLFSAHAGAVLDTAFSPFDDDVIASGAEDHQAMVWRVPGDLAEREEDVTAPLAVLGGHGRKVGHVVWNPVAENVLAVSSSDHTVRIWDVEACQVQQTLGGFGDTVLSVAWSHDGRLLAATCRDKKLRIFDARSGALLQEGASHMGVKGSRVVWLGATDRLVTTGFSRSSDREVFLWNANDLSKPLVQLDIDMSAGMLMPFYDESTRMLYVAGKGDGNIRYYEYADDKLYSLSEYQSPEPQRGLGLMTKRGLDVRRCEVARFYKVASNSLVEPISFRVPRKAESFQSDIYPPAHAGKPAMTAAEYFAGKNAEPLMVDMKELYDNGPLVAGSGQGPVRLVPAQASPASSPAPVKAASPAPAKVPSPAPVKASSPAPVKASSPVPTKAPSPEPTKTPSPEPRAASPVRQSMVPQADPLELAELRKETERLQAQLTAAQEQHTREVGSLQAELSQQQATGAGRLQTVESRLKQAVEDADSLRSELERVGKEAEQYKEKLGEASARAQEQERTTGNLEAELRTAIDAANALAQAAEKAADSLQH